MIPILMTKQLLINMCMGNYVYCEIRRVWNADDRGFDYEESKT